MGETRETRAGPASGESVTREKRRGFLRFLGLGGVVGTAATMLGTRAQAAIVAEPDEGYRETEHVSRYYESTRF